MAHLWSKHCPEEGFIHLSLYGAYVYCPVCMKFNPTPPANNTGPPPPYVANNEAAVSIQRTAPRIHGGSAAAASLLVVAQPVAAQPVYESNAPSQSGMRAFPSLPDRQTVEAARAAAFDQRRATHAGAGTVAARRAAQAAQGHPPPNSGATRPAKAELFRYKVAVYTQYVYTNMDSTEELYEEIFTTGWKDAFTADTYGASGLPLIDFILSRGPRGLDLNVYAFADYDEHWFCDYRFSDSHFPTPISFQENEDLTQAWAKFDSHRQHGKVMGIVVRQKGAPIESLPASQLDSPTPQKPSKKPAKGKDDSLRDSLAAASTLKKQPSTKKPTRKRGKPTPQKDDDDDDALFVKRIKPEPMFSTPKINPAKPPAFVNLDTPLPLHPASKRSSTELSEIDEEEFKASYDSGVETHRESNTADAELDEELDEELPDNPLQMPPQPQKRVIAPSDRELRGRK
ncbi:hypothetical protein B0A48_18724 [Cryoendolithus antarcticus]|uniref:Uncharacterized protein n=1 Tax=Cryoendolithus antarcticus TaxID=1507870 RepID=A0A1V8S7Z2_9PEZI|nr:hypothetical protein B0A48_18724 [Cryoendolithus antarcticus]